MKTTLRIGHGLALLALSSLAQADEPNNPPAVNLIAQATSAVDIPAQLRQIGERLDALEKQSRNQGVLTLFNQVAELKTEVARLRGQVEESVHKQQLADKRTKDLYGDLDTRLKGLGKPAPAPAATPSAAPRADSAPPPAATSKPAAPAVDADAEAKSYEAAIGLIKEGNYPAATQAFQGFLHTFPSAALASNALYWLGLSQFSQGDVKAAAATQQRLLKEYPLSAKVPDAMVNLARSLMQLGDAEASRRLLDKVVAEHPASKAADTARKMQELNK